jgi:hypothetical protein
MSIKCHKCQTPLYHDNSETFVTESAHDCTAFTVKIMYSQLGVDNPKVKLCLTCTQLLLNSVIAKLKNKPFQG